MAHSKKALSRFMTADMGRTNQTDFYVYSSNHTLAEVISAGFFNDSRTTIGAGDVVLAMIDKDGSPAFVVLTFASVPDTGDVTVKLESPVLGQANVADLALTPVTGVDGAGSNAASAADVDARFASVQATVNALIANLETAGVNAPA
ncbi:hypothetical protein H1W37_19470 [Stappia taiwanensis]|uniref:Uncharacterized protein n=1 Tax=Stappia taiwanensis TaxID=992267 RepID=A0A838Y4G0_9HYPH|nr:hypothetical protein [Stappia taiwanensis]MBA4613843.1 hypothetical protein [Stappia taiwanensis]GGE79103.1 hypothetical protein GCM10007285_03650 [Stappia taiwanensis]